MLVFEELRLQADDAVGIIEFRTGGIGLQEGIASPELYDAYRIISLEPKLFEYEHFVSGSRYTVRRVNSSFALPD